MHNFESFRLGLLTVNGRCPRWMWKSLQPGVDQRHVTLAAVLSLPAAPRKSSSWIVEAYAGWERRRYLTRGDILEDLDVASVSGHEVVAIDPGDFSAVMTEYGFDLILVTPQADQVELHGVDLPIWKIRFGVSESQQAEPGLWEVVERSLSTVSLIESVPSSSSERVLETIVTRTDPRSWIRNQLQLTSKASDLLTRWVPPTSFRAQHARKTILTANGLTAGPEKRSSRAVMRLLARFGNHARTSALNVEQWQLAFATSQDMFQLVDPEVLVPPPDRFWCDPFLLQKDGALHVFVEEYLYESERGHISMLSKSSSGEWSPPVRVLERPYHLSYPSVFEYQGELLMLPESTAAGRVELYRCVQFPDRWELDTVLIENFAGADSTLWLQDERWWMFVDVRDELHLLYADSPRGPWQQHRGNPVKSDSRSGRPAGCIFRRGSDTIRPAQDCSLQYGREVVFNKMVRLNVSEFEEVEIGRLCTPWNGNTACHTFNQLAGTTVVDRLVTRRKQ